MFEPPIAELAMEFEEEIDPETPEHVEWLQRSLNQIRGLRLPEDGVLGPATRSALRNFQSQQGLDTSGILNSLTERSLMTAGATPHRHPERHFEAELESEVKRKSRDYIKWVQQALNRIMGLQLAVDGISGTQTRSAIRSFQQKHGLAIDGIVGAQTERALIAAGAASPPGSGSTPTPSVPTPSPYAFRPLPVETPGGGRIQDKRAPAAADLVTVSGVGGKQVQLHRLAADAWRAMVSAARSAGISDPLLLPTSGYRSPEYQKQLWDKALARYGSPEEARKWVAPPGGSAHQSGRAIDLYLGGKNDSRNVNSLRTLAAYKWLAADAGRFGFYPYGAEPWHWEYNPPA
jgi:peptidoglycan hydrolase-like protein with peptidoglycan-binding domain